MEEAIRPFSTLFGNRTYLRSLCEGAAFLAASTIAIYAAVGYATIHASNPVTDLVLSRIGPFNVRFLFIYGTFTALGFTACLLVRRPNRLPFALKAMALFLLVRAVFVALTHIAPSPIDPQQPAPFFNSILYGSDLFFSGHTGLPFLAALAFHGVFQLSCWLFGRDYALFKSSESEAKPRQKRTRRKLFPVGGGGRASEPFTLHAVPRDQMAADPRG